MADEDQQRTRLGEAAWLWVKKHPRPPLAILLVGAADALANQANADGRLDSAYGFAVALIGAMYGVLGLRFVTPFGLAAAAGSPITVEDVSIDFYSATAQVIAILVLA